MFKKNFLSEINERLNYFFDHVKMLNSMISVHVIFFFLTPQVQHPAAKMLVLAAQQMEQEVGDGTNFVMVFAGALLQYAEDILRMVSNNIAITVC